MQYIYGISQRFGTPCENLKTVGDKHSDLNGYIQTVITCDGTKITDHCRVIRKYASKESNGTCYDWYLIDSHYRETDTTKKAQARAEKLSANLDYISMMSGIDIPQEEGETNEWAQRQYETVKRYYDNGLWNEIMVRNAVGRWITEEEYKEIVGDN